MARELIWDLPTRVFHWALAGGIVAAAGIALAGDDGPLFQYHALLGLALIAVVGLRLVWALIGTHYARVGAFAFSPGAVVSYFGGVFGGRRERPAGHNPASAYAVLAMFILFVGLAVTGVMLGTGREGVKELHEILTYALLGVAGVHILGVAVHSVRYRENLTRSMIDGRKEADPAAAIRSPRPLAAAVLAGLALVWTVALVRGHDTAAQSLRVPFVGTTLQLGEAEHRAAGRGDAVGSERGRHED